jgi:hypothetical protein
MHEELFFTLSSQLTMKDTFSIPLKCKFVILFVISFSILEEK